MARYAEGTTVPAEKSQAEVNAILKKHGATHIMTGEGPEATLIQFKLNDRMFRFGVNRATADEMRARYIAESTYGDWQAQRSADRIDWPGRAAQEWRRRWRARVIWLKSLIEFTDDVPLEQSMLANLVLPDGRTFDEWSAPQVEAMYASGHMPPMLGDGR